MTDVQEPEWGYYNEVGEFISFCEDDEDESDGFQVQDGSDV